MKMSCWVNLRQITLKKNLENYGKEVVALHYCTTSARKGGHFKNKTAVTLEKKIPIDTIAALIYIAGHAIRKEEQKEDTYFLYEKYGGLYK